MTPAELITSVYTETNRPDLVPETLQAVLEAVLSVHTIDNFYKDIQEAVIVFDNKLSYIQQLDTTSLPLYRNMSYVRKSDPGVNLAEQYNFQWPYSQIPPSTTRFNFLTYCEIDNVIDSFGYEKIDIWYQAGRNINMKSSTALQYATFGYYKYPNTDIANGNFDSWIAIEQPWSIIYKAAGNLFAKIGEDKSYAIYMKAPIPGRGEETGGLYYQQLAQLRRNNIVAQG